MECQRHFREVPAGPFAASLTTASFTTGNLMIMSDSCRTGLRAG